MLSIRHLDTIIEADRCSCLQLMSSPRPAARWKWVKISVWIRIFSVSGDISHVYSLWFHMECYSSFDNKYLNKYIFLRPLNLPVSHVSCFPFHPWLLVMDLRCKMQDSSEEREEGGGGVSIDFFPLFFLAFILYQVYRESPNAQLHGQKCKCALSSTPMQTRSRKHENTRFWHPRHTCALVPLVLEPKQLSLAQMQHQGLR